MADDARLWLDRIRELPGNDPVRLLNVCGGHERALSLGGLRSVLPDHIELIPGPGCPVCVCPEEDIYLAIQLALHEPVTLVSFGDMLRVPVNVPKREPRSLAEARAAGADVRPLASPQEAVQIARRMPDRAVVFLAAGFETTMAPVAAMLSEGVPDNLFVLLAGRRTWPAVAHLLDSGQVGFNALIAPGHVSAIMGPEEWEFVATRHGLPVAIAGFTPVLLLAAIHAVLHQHRDGQARLENRYPAVVPAGGNPVARRLLDEVFEVIDAPWRGIGSLPASGYALRPALAAHDARLAFHRPAGISRRRRGEMPAGCDCARVVLGQIRPNECVLYGRACAPHNPIGPCMVSDEGACRIWWQAGQAAQAVRQATARNAP